MRCWNCGHKVRKKARVCERCEADLTDAPSAEEGAAVAEMMTQMPPDIFAEMAEMMSRTSSAEEFANLIMVGACPKCGSEKTGDCDADPEINDLITGRCYECGQLWCTECGKLLTREKPHCDCLDDEE